MPRDNEINELVKLFTKMAEGSKSSSKDIKELVTLMKSQLTELRNVQSRPEANFTAEQTEEVFESKDAEEAYQKNMIEAEENLAELSDEQLEELMGLNDSMEDLVETVKEDVDTKNRDRRERKQREKIEHKGSEETKGYFRRALSYLGETYEFLAEKSGLDKLFHFREDIWNAIKSNFDWVLQGIDALLLTPMKGILSAFQGVWSFVTSPIKSLFGSMFGGRNEKIREDKEDKQNRLMQETLESIEKNTSPEDEMIKGGGILDWLKKLPAMFGFGKTGIGGKLGGMLWKAAGVGMILGGLYMAVQDFMDGFAEGGLGTGLFRAFVGKTDQGIKGTLKNAGKWALIGAGIGTLIVPVVGTIAGGLLGGAIGWTINSMAQIFQGTGSAGSKLGETILGKQTGGYMEAIKLGGRWALVGAGIGTTIAPGIGTIAGGLIGFATGTLINFIYQILDPSIVAGIDKMFSIVGSWISGAWNWLWSSADEAITWGLNIIKGKWNSAMILMTWAMDMIGKAFTWIGDGIMWVAEKLGVEEYIIMAKERISGAWTAVEDTFNAMIDWITNFASNIWDSFKTVMGQYWGRIKTFFGIKGEPEQKGQTPVTLNEPAKVDTKKESNFIDSGIKSSGYMKSVAEETPVMKQEIVEGNKVSKDLAGYMKGIYEFLRGDMLNKIERYFQDTSNFLVDSMWMLEFDRRAWNYQVEHGSLSGYSDAVSTYKKELEKLERGREEGYRGGKDIIAQQIDNSNVLHQSNTTIGSIAENLRQKIPRI